MIRTTAAGLLALGLCLGSQAALVDLRGPDGSVRFQLATDGERHLVYSVTVNGIARLGEAPAGIIVQGTDLGAAAQPGEPRRKSMLEVFPWRGNKTSGTNHCEAYEIPVKSGSSAQWTLEVRVFNDGAAFRYRVPGQGSRRITGESTRWSIPGNATLWLQTDTTSYEGDYHSCRADAVPLETEVRKKIRPTHLGPPVTIEYADGGYGLVSEAALYRYSGLTLRPEGGGRFRAAFEDNANGWDHDGEILSPWRVIILSPDLNGLVNSDVIPALCEAPDPKLFPDGFNTAWLRPGKAPCTWMVYGNDGAQWHRQKWWVDLCVKIGCEYLLVDAGWRTEKWGWLRDGGDVWARAAELCAYAAERNVGIILWHAYPEGRDDGPGLTTIAARDELFQKCKAAGVKGVKIDFFNSESKTVIEAYEDLLRRAAENQLLINFHGANKPTGEPRTWPNEITREGIREQEYLLWSTIPLPHYGALPFTRMAVGHADFLPGYAQERFLKNTTVIFQMASVVVFNSPFLCWPDNPEAYLNSPLLTFVRSVPVTWEETRVLPGSKIGETVIMARRNADSWYVAALNCRSQSQDLEIDLSTLDVVGKEMTLYRDNEAGQGCHIQSGLKPSIGKMRVSLRSGGGFLAVFRPPKTYPGWR